MISRLKKIFNQIGLEGKNVVHLCCNNGTELMSLKNLDTAECVGFDISDLAIREASGRANNNHTNCQFDRTNVYEIDNIFDDQSIVWLLRQIRQK